MESAQADRELTTELDIKMPDATNVTSCTLQARASYHKAEMQPPLRSSTICELVADTT